MHDVGELGVETAAISCTGQRVLRGQQQELLALPVGDHRESQGKRAGDDDRYQDGGGGLGAVHRQDRGQQSDDHDDREDDRLSRMDEVKRGDQRREDPVDLLRTDEVDGREYAGDAENRDGDAGRTHAMRHIHVASEGQEARDDGYVDACRQPLAVYDAQQRKGQDTERACRRENQREIGFKVLASIVGADDIPPGVHS